MPASLAVAADQQVTRADLAQFRDELIAELHQLLGGQKEERLLRLNEVEQKVGYRRPTIYLKIKQGEFPAPVDLGGHASAWRLSDVNRWIEERAALKPGQRRMPPPRPKGFTTSPTGSSPK